MTLSADDNITTVAPASSLEITTVTPPADLVLVQDSALSAPSLRPRFNNTNTLSAANCHYQTHGFNNDNAVRPAAVRARRFEDVYEPIPRSRCGSGSTSVVVQVRRRSDGRLFACKICYVHDGHSRLCGDTDFDKWDQASPKERQIHREIEIMNKLRRKQRLGMHQGCSIIDGPSSLDNSITNDSSSAFNDPSAGIAMFVDTYVSYGRDDSSSTKVTVYMMVSELMNGGDLRSALVERGSYAEDDARAVMKQLLSSLVFLHDGGAGVTHRDIKLENILLPSELDPTKIKLADFGLSAAATSAKPSMTQRCGTPLYAAPEVLERNPLYSNKVDLWSSGVVLFMLLSGYPPFWGETGSEIVQSISAAGPDFNDPVWELISEEAKDLVLKLLTKNPLERLSARAALLHPWLADEGQW